MYAVKMLTSVLLPAVTYLFLYPLEERELASLGLPKEMSKPVSKWMEGVTSCGLAWLQGLHSWEIVGLAVAVVVVVATRVLYFGGAASIERTISPEGGDEEATKITDRWKVGAVSSWRGGNLRRRPKRGMRDELPPPFPNGWYMVSLARSLKRGDVKFLSLLGVRVALFRGESGKVGAVDAFCPHLGANLGVGGTVVGDCVRCPFHAWEFDSSGKCTRIPYTKGPIPASAKTKSYHVQERNGMILLWHDAEKRKPLWEVPVVREVEEGKFRYHGYSVHHVNAHLQELPENGADVNHFDALHGAFMVDSLAKILHHEWEGDWKEGGPNGEKHMAQLSVFSVIRAGKFRLPGTQTNVAITQIGPGVVMLRFRTPLGQAIMFETVTPLGPMLQQTTHTIYAEWTMPRVVAIGILKSTIVQYERDAFIFNNKLFQPRPMLVKEDVRIRRFRDWFAQFYSAHSADAWDMASLDW